MATSSFHVDDQTDEDFFDKLVDDDDDDNNDVSNFKPSINANVSDFDLASLSLGDESVSNYNNNNLVEPKENNNNNVDEIRDLDKKPKPKSNSNSSSGSVIEHVGDGYDDVATPDSPSGGVKVVQWTAFGVNDDNGVDFFNELGEDGTGTATENQLIGSGIGEVFNENVGNSSSEVAGVEQSFEYWENQYPGWKFDVNTGQWYQIDVPSGTNGTNGTNVDFAGGDTSQISYLRQGSETGIGGVVDSGTVESVSCFDNSLQKNDNWTDRSNLGVNNGYPEHMIFDPQYPGWYYDSIALEWRSLESYTSTFTSTATAQVHNHDKIHENVIHKNVYESTLAPSYENPQTNFGNYSQVNSYNHQGTRENVYESNLALSRENSQADFGNYNQVNSYNHQGAGADIQTQDFNNYGQQGYGYNTWQPEKNKTATWDSIGNQQSNSLCTNLSMVNNVSRQNSFDARGTVPFYQNVNQGSQSFVPTVNFNHQQVNQLFIPQNNVGNDYYPRQNLVSSPSQQFRNDGQFSPVSNAGRSSAGRPPHALVAFGFGGKLIVMKDDNSLGASSYGAQGSLGDTISVFNLAELVMEKNDLPSIGAGGSDYFNSLCKRSFPGPLVGGNVGTKEVNKWIDEKILSFGAPGANYRTDDVLKLVFSLLKISCQYYGKLRSPFGTEAALRENDAPESAVARLFASVKGNTAEFNNYNALAHCLQSLPSEEQMRANAAEVQRLLVCGKKKEALEFATDGQLWGPALVLAAQLGDQYYCDTVKQMALRQLVAGSPLRTLCLLIAGQPAEVFSSDSSASNIPGSANTFQQPTPLQHGINSMLDHWEENLAVITANRTKDDELVLVHLGDSLWKNRSDIVAAHICYLVAEATFEPYSDSARLCLIGADHWKLPRTYATPDAIQRTEIYEYSKVLGNSQFIVPSFQPYKLIYALMLAEVGKVSESLKYCQGVSKSLKTGRTPEVDTLRQLVSSFEERLKTHQQGGFSSNLAPAKIVHKLLNLFDSTASRVVGGGLPPPIPSPSQSRPQANDLYSSNIVPRMPNSQSTMAMSSLIPSMSAEPSNKGGTGDGNRLSLHNRSVSEPDIGRTPRQGDSSKETAQGKASAASRFGRFGFGSQLLQKTVGLVMKPRQDKQAKLGDSNKFYYDEKLKRWVEEGAELPAEEVAPPPPPTSVAFQNGMPDYSLKNSLKSEGTFSNGGPEFRSPSSSDHSSGIPPLPTASNQFSARGRMGVRSRYVDTFNKGGNSANSFQSPAVPFIKPVTGTNPKFFVPSPVSPAEHSHESTQYIAQEAAPGGEMSSIPSVNNSPFPSPTASVGIQNFPNSNGSFPSPPPQGTMQRYPSMDNITRREKTVNGSGLISSSSRRTASWSGSLNDASSPPNRTGVKPLGEVLGMPPSLFMPNDPSVAPLARNNCSFGEDLHEVEF